MGDKTLPKTDEDLLDLPAQYQRLDNGEQFLVLCKQLPGGVALIFMSQFGRPILNQSECWSLDGTFTAKPEEFSQLYVVFGSGGPVSEKIYPCAYLLLPKKDGPTYMHALNVLASEIDNAPKSVSIDFEQAVIKACRDVFPTNPSVNGCRFHRKKNLYHQVGGTVEYK